MCNVAEASQNAYLALIFYHYPCLKRSDQSYILILTCSTLKNVIIGKSLLTIYQHDYRLDDAPN